MTKIKLDVLNFHEIFRNEIIKVDDIVENLRSGEGLDLIVKVDKEDLEFGYAIYGHSKIEDGRIIERKYWTREHEHINKEITQKFKSSSDEAIKYNKKLEITA